jgi:hypothetical protein
VKTLTSAGDEYVDTAAIKLTGETMHIDVGGVSAKCFVCGSNDFESLRARPGEPSDKLTCTDCCAEVSYDDLLSQIGRIAIARQESSQILEQWTRGTEVRPRP